LQGEPREIEAAPGKPVPEFDADRPGFSVVASWRGSNVVQVIAKKDGEVVGLGTYDVSADGRELSITDAVSDMHIILERPSGTVKICLERPIEHWHRGGGGVGFTSIGNKGK
jgi:hypothetical protein